MAWKEAQRQASKSDLKERMSALDVIFLKI
jgi:hypothetical protein